MVGKGHIGDMVTLKKASSSSSSASASAAAASSAPSSASSFASSSCSAFASAYPLKRFPTRRSVFCCRCCCRIFSTSTIIFRLRDLKITTSTQPSGIFSVLLVSKWPVDLTERQFVRWRNRDAACRMTQLVAIECDVTKQVQNGGKPGWRITFSLDGIYLKVPRNAYFRRRCNTGLTYRRCLFHELTVLKEQT